MVYDLIRIIIHVCQIKIFNKFVSDKFIPFKTPLDSRYDKKVEEYRFNFNMLLQSLENHEVSLFIMLITFTVVINKYLVF
jgi:hypothetical protein